MDLRYAAMRAEPRDYQIPGLSKAKSREGTYLAVRMGGGKTFMTISLQHAWKARHSIVFCPKSVIPVWPRELEKFSQYPFRVLTLSSGSNAKKTDELKKAIEVSNAEGRALVVVVNHESAWRGDLGSAIKAHRWDLGVCDEIHRAKAPGGRFSRFLGSLAYRCDHRLGLSGTPLPHSRLDAYGQFRFVEPGLFGGTVSEFKRRYCLRRDSVAVGETERLGSPIGSPLSPDAIFGFTNLEDFDRRFHSATYVYTADLGLPPETDLDRFVELEPDAARAYGELEEKFFTWVGEGVDVTPANALVRLLRLQQVTGGDVRGDDGALHEVSRAKEKVLDEWLDDVTRPAVVFCRFKSDLDRVRRVTAARGERYGEISGREKTGLDDRAELAAGVDIVGAQIDSGGIGIDLTKARDCLFYSLGFRLDSYLQARARLHRPGQEHPVTFTHLLASETVDTAVLETLQRREAVVESILSKAKQHEPLR